MDKLTTTHVECEVCRNKTLVILPASLLPREDKSEQLTLFEDDSPLLRMIEAFRFTAGMCFPSGDEE